MKIESSSHSTHTSAGTRSGAKVEKKSGKRIGYHYIILKSLKESTKNDVIKCLYIKGLFSFGFCVVKEGSYGDIKDTHGRDIKDRLQWQKYLHETLRGKVHLPKLLDSFEENGNYYLVLEYIKGRSLLKEQQKYQKELPRSFISGGKLAITFIDYLIQIIEILSELHKNGYIHRDVTPANFMISTEGKVYVIDMELSYSLDQVLPHPFQLGTHGYMSNQQKHMETPTVKEDIFSVGAIIFQVLTNIHPIKLVDPLFENIVRKVNFFIDDSKVSEIITKCLHPISEARPTLENIKKILVQYKTSIKNRSLSGKSNSGSYSIEEISRTINQTITTISTPLFSDENGWFSDKITPRSGRDKNKTDKAWYVNFNRGVLGIIYMLSKAHSVGLNVDSSKINLDKGLHLLKEQYINNIDSLPPGLHYGATGIAAALATAVEYGLLSPIREYDLWINELLRKQSTTLGYMHGQSGDGIANMLCAKYVDEKLIEQRLENYTANILDRQEKNGSWTKEILNRRKIISKGFANGVSGIIYFLLTYGQNYNNKEALISAHSGLQWLMKTAVHKKDSIIWFTTDGKELMPWWCEGSAGIALCFLKAYSVSGYEEYKEYARGALYNHDKNKIHNNLSQCHGLSGLGEIYLEAAKILKDDEWKSRADWIVQVIMHLKKEHRKYGSFWLVENERTPVADFMIGNSGVLHFLLRYCYTNRLSFPMLPN